VHAHTRQKWWLLLPLICGVIFALTDINELLRQTGSPRQSAFGAYTFALLLIALRPWDTQFSASVFTQPVSWCGRMCYSLYLVHMPIVKLISHGLWMAGLQSTMATCLVTVPLCLLTSILAGYVFYLRIERHFLNTREPAPATPAPVMPATAAVPGAVV
jgi:peptidoglycan/LPS O-acetylase OafA/YrhL